MKNLATPIVWRGVLAIAVGIIAISWPGITIWAFVVLFAVYAFLAAAMEAAQAFGSATAGPVAGRLLMALLDVAAGVAALAWPRHHRAGIDASRRDLGLHHRLLRAVPRLRRWSGRR